MVSPGRKSNFVPKRQLMFSISVAIIFLCGWTSSNLCCYALETKDYGYTKPKKTVVRRENNLDHWDSDTLAYYLDEYPGYDLAVMFYASWDEHSHKLAPYWNQIAHILGAGTTKSKLIMVSWYQSVRLVYIPTKMMRP